MRKSSGFIAASLLAAFLFGNVVQAADDQKSCAYRLFAEGVRGVRDGKLLSRVRPFVNEEVAVYAETFQMEEFAGGRRRSAIKNGFATLHEFLGDFALTHLTAIAGDEKRPFPERRAALEILAAMGGRALEMLDWLRDELMAFGIPDAYGLLSDESDELLWHFAIAVLKISPAPEKEWVMVETPLDLWLEHWKLKLQDPDQWAMRVGLFAECFNDAGGVPEKLLGKFIEAEKILDALASELLFQKPDMPLPEGLVDALTALRVSVTLAQMKRPGPVFFAATIAEFLRATDVGTFGSAELEQIRLFGKVFVGLSGVRQNSIELEEFTAILLHRFRQELSSQALAGDSTVEIQNAYISFLVALRQVTPADPKRLLEATDFIEELQSFDPLMRKIHIETRRRWMGNTQRDAG